MKLQALRNFTLGAVLAVLTTSCTQPTDDIATSGQALGLGNDTLYVGDFVGGGTNSVQAFQTPTGTPLGTFVVAGTTGLFGPTGLVFDRPEGSTLRGDLLVANQNFNQPFNGSLLLFDGTNGAFERTLVAVTDPNGPFDPQGIVVRDGIVYVADFENGPPALPFGSIKLYDDATGAFLQDLDTTGFNGLFYPRGLVFGRDGLLYVANVPSRNTGQVLRFDPATRAFVDVFVDSASCGCDLARPEGLVFGPQGGLYVTSFQTSSDDNDKILIFDEATGAFVDRIDLDTPDARAFAQAILFGPGGFLYVPITGNASAYTGEVRRYNVHTKNYEVLVPPQSAGGPMGEPAFLTFCNTDPATLAYDPVQSGVRCK